MGQLSDCLHRRGAAILHYKEVHMYELREELKAYLTDDKCNDAKLLASEKCCAFGQFLLGFCVLQNKVRFHIE